MRRGKKITIEAYNKLMHKVIQKNAQNSIEDTFIKLIEEAGKHEVIDERIKDTKRFTKK